MPKPRPERHAQLQSELDRCQSYFARMSAELDPSGKDRSSVIIEWIGRYIAELQYTLAQEQLPPSERGKG